MSDEIKTDTAATEGCAAVTGYALLCAALNRLIWKCPVPDHVGGLIKNNVDAWAEYWLGELRDGPDGHRIEGIEWDRSSSEFRPTHSNPPEQRP